MELYDLLAQVVRTFERLRIPYLVTGSVASMAYGEPRLTNDIDVVAGIREADISDMVAAFPAPEFYLSDEAIRDAICRDGQFNIIHPGSGLCGETRRSIAAGLRGLARCARPSHTRQPLPRRRMSLSRKWNISAKADRKSICETSREC